MSTKRDLCMFVTRGGCSKGEYCEFSHEWNNQPNNVCTFYQKGACRYGSRCRYVHANVSCNPTVQLPPPSTSASGHLPSTSLQLLSSGQHPHMGHETDKSTETQQLSMDMLAHSASEPARRNDVQQDIVSEDGIDSLSNQTVQNQTSMRPADVPICSLAAGGNCRYGEKCLQMHGERCTACGKMFLHSYRPDALEKHIKFCERRLETLKQSKEITCSICLELVLSKPTVHERKFGILPECDHHFCIGCIRTWRSKYRTSDLDVNPAVRVCPLCGILSNYVVPSVLWYLSKEEKQEIIERYKSKLNSIDCKYFNFGTGVCRFRKSCFYKHADRDGRLEDIVKDTRLSDSLSQLGPGERR